VLFTQWGGCQKFSFGNVTRHPELPIGTRRKLKVLMTSGLDRGRSCQLLFAPYLCSLKKFLAWKNACCLKFWVARPKLGVCSGSIRTVSGHVIIIFEGKGWRKQRSLSWRTVEWGMILNITGLSVFGSWIQLSMAYHRVERDPLGRSIRRWT
jgi:hypothetical protein